MPLAPLARFCRAAMAMIEVVDGDGDTKCGSGFHIGDGYFVTAEHVANPEGGELAAVYLEAERVGLRLADPHQPTDVWCDAATDLAVLRLATAPGRHIQLGAHLDDWINDEQFVLEEVLIMGYPPIPRTEYPVLVAVSGEINAVVDRYDRGGATPDFVVSPLPRGGFSGGPALFPPDIALGVVNQGLANHGDHEALGFTAVTSVEPLWVLLADNGIRPTPQADFMNDVFPEA